MNQLVPRDAEGPIPFGRLLGLILILDAAILLPGLGRAALARIDEGQIAEVSREMAANGDWVTPRIGGLPFAAYPPLAYWLFAASGTVFGFNEFAMRLPTALAALALVAVTAHLARRLAGAEAGLSAAMVLATLPSFFIQGSVCRADVLTMLFATAGFDRFLAWAEGARRKRDLALMYLFTALGILAKGPLAVAMLGLGGFSWFLLKREWKLLLEMKFWIGIPAALAIVVPWYLAVWRVNGGGFLYENIVLENFTAYKDGYQQKRPVYFYLKEMPLLAPWLALLPFSARARRAPGVALSLMWFGLILLFLTISSAKRVNYLTYACPPLALAVATTMTALRSEAPRLLANTILVISGVLVAGAALGAALPASTWTGADVSKIALMIPKLAVAFAAGAGLVAAICRKWGPRAGVATFAGFLALAFFSYGFEINPQLNPENRDAADFCRRAAAKVPPGETLAVPYPEGIEGLYHFYAGAALPMRDGSPGLYLASEIQHDRLSKAGKNIQILDSMLDHRGRSRYLLRIHP